MSFVRYRTESGHSYIDQVAVKEETRSFVVLLVEGGRDVKVRIDSGSVKYHKTWESARQFLIRRIKDRLVNVKEQFLAAKHDLDILGKMDDPSKKQ